MEPTLRLAPLLPRTLPPYDEGYPRAGDALPDAAMDDTSVLQVMPGGSTAIIAPKPGAAHAGAITLRVTAFSPEHGLLRVVGLPARGCTLTDGIPVGTGVMSARTQDTT